MSNFTIKISEEGLNTIIIALECYSRLGINQFDLALENHPKFAALPYEKRREIEEYLKKQIDDRGLGIYNEEVEPFTKAYNIKKECEKWRIISREPIRKFPDNSYDGALDEDKEYLPKFYSKDGVVIKDEIRIPISSKDCRALKAIQKKYGTFNKIWEYADANIDKGGVKGGCYYFTEDFKFLIIEEPYKYENLEK